MPIILQVPSEQANSINLGNKIQLKDHNDNIVLLHVEDIYSVNKSEYSKLWYGTDDLEHPGVCKFFKYGDMVIGGKIFASENLPNWIVLVSGNEEIYGVVRLIAQAIYNICKIRLVKHEISGKKSLS